MVGFATEPRRMQADGRTLERQRRYRDYTSEDVLAQTELLGKIDTSWARHEILLSTELGQLDYKQNQLRRNHSTSSTNTIDIYQPEYGKYLPNLTRLPTPKSASVTALNVQDQIFFNDQWSVLFGNRFDQVEQDFKNHIKQTEDNQTLHQNSPRFE